LIKVNIFQFHDIFKRELCLKIANKKITEKQRVAKNVFKTVCKTLLDIATNANDYF